MYFHRPQGTSETHLINPSGAGTTNTINRAELSGVKHAIMLADLEGHLFIYTDSLCSIYMIKRMINEPWTLTESKHCELLQDIVGLLRVRVEKNLETTICKVVSHTGILGGDEADRGAKEAAMHPLQGSSYRDRVQ